MSPVERKQKVAALREEHEDYFQTIGNINALFIPKMAYRPVGMDDLHISFFPSELQKESDIYTEFVSIDYDSEDPKRTLYLLKHNPNWSKYKIVTSSSGFERHLVPVKDLIAINDVVTRNKETNAFNTQTALDLPSPDERSIVDVLIGIEKALLSINEKLNK
jgi:hypothetical protein